MADHNEFPAYWPRNPLRALEIAFISEPAENDGGDCFMTPADSGFEHLRIRLSLDWLLRFHPKPGGYYVVYRGVVTYADAEFFHDGYVEGLKALRALGITLETKGDDHG
jgi:hypothetical protein